MAYYTNEASLKATYGDDEVAALVKEQPGISSAVRLDKAAATAQAEIDMLLHTANYVTPFEGFTPFGTDPWPVDGVALNPVIQAISDCFTAWHLASSADLQKKRYDDCRAQGLAWLDRIIAGEVVLEVTNVDPLAGPGNLVVIARPSVFNRYQLRERQIFPGSVDD